MARSLAPHDDLEVDVPQVLDHLRLQGDVVQDEFVTQCFFHSETGSPNLEINNKSGLWHCWVCGERGNLPKLVMRLQGVSYREAIEILQDYSSMPDISVMRNRNLAALATILSPVRHTFEEVDIERYKHGRSFWWTNQIPNGRFSKTTVREWSLGFDTSTRRAVIPVSHDGAFVGVIKRATTETQSPRYLYTGGFDRRYVLYGLDGVPTHSDSCVVVEGAKDALRIREYGISTSVASLGTGLTQEQLALIEERFDEVTVFSDNDAAGHVAALKMCSDLADRVARVFVVQWLVERKDPNELDEATMRRMLARRIHWTALVEPDYDPYKNH